MGISVLRRAEMIIAFCCCRPRTRSESGRDSFHYYYYSDGEARKV